ncbi:MAG: hypothetical protein ACTH0V_05075 [Microbacteriaceae bacterium]
MSAKISQTTKEVTVYSVGGREFVDKTAAEAHAEKLNQRLGYAFYVVRSGFDLTEGRGYFTSEVVGIRLVHTPASGTARLEPNSIVAYCLAQHGDPVDEFYGRPVGRWTYSKPEEFSDVGDLDAWLDQQRRRGRGYSQTFRGVFYADEFGRLISDEES